MINQSLGEQRGGITAVKITIGHKTCAYVISDRKICLLHKTDCMSMKIQYGQMENDIILMSEY